jgi:hypothetical protein
VLHGAEAAPPVPVAADAAVRVARRDVGEPVTAFLDLLDGSQPCIGRSELFFPPRIDSTRALAAARAICNRCPFAAPCLSYALTEHSIGERWLDGIWSGTTFSQRQRIREKRGAA